MQVNMREGKKEGVEGGDKEGRKGEFGNYLILSSNIQLEKNLNASIIPSVKRGDKILFPHRQFNKRLQ